eukprot:COSAG04_NODE_23071_length_344_cov_1.004082_1_plen_41_part_10
MTSAGGQDGEILTDLVKRGRRKRVLGLVACVFIHTQQHRAL